jgi:hypothetical protein
MSSLASIKEPSFAVEPALSQALSAVDVELDWLSPYDLVGDVFGRYEHQDEGAALSNLYPASISFPAGAE